jgi:crotonobetainyl-CoA:carnitine CoA-transferase CaiB-like acyl-CoA transferase
VLGSLSFVDQAAGLTLANAVLAALFQRERTGLVEHVEANLLDTAIYLQSAPLLESSVTGNMLDQRKHASRYPMVGSYAAADGPLYVAGYRDPEWVAICEVLGHPELADDPRFATSDQRSTHAELIRELFTEGFATRPRAEWVSALEARGVLAGEIRTHAELLEFSQVAVNGSVERLELRDGREGAFARLPFRFAGRTPAPSVAAPDVGAHSDEILELAGFPPQERDRLRRTGAVASGAPSSVPC